MTLRYLLDTNVVSDFVRGEARVHARLKSTPPSEIAVSVVTVMETTYGLARGPARARKLHAILDAIYSSVEILPLSIEDARSAGAVRAALSREGRPIGSYASCFRGARSRAG